MKDRILFEKHSRLSSLPNSQTASQAGMAETEIPLVQVSINEWLETDAPLTFPGLVSPEGSQTMSLGYSPFTYGAQSTVQDVFYHTAPDEGSANTTSNIQAEGYAHSPLS
jgi:hypothetical protein